MEDNFLQYICVNVASFMSSVLKLFPLHIWFWSHHTNHGMVPIADKAAPVSGGAVPVTDATAPVTVKAIHEVTGVAHEISWAVPIVAGGAVPRTSPGVFLELVAVPVAVGAAPVAGEIGCVGTELHF